MQIRFPRRGLAVILLWFSLLGTGLVFFIRWQTGPLPGYLAGITWLIAALFLYRRMTGVHIHCSTAGRLSIYSGRLFPLHTTVAAGAVLRVSILSTPLLRVAGCRILTLHTLHGQIVLPGLSSSDCEALCSVVCPAGPSSAG